MHKPKFISKAEITGGWQLSQCRLLPGNTLHHPRRGGDSQKHLVEDAEWKETLGGAKVHRKLLGSNPDTNSNGFHLLHDLIKHTQPSNPFHFLPDTV